MMETKTNIDRGLPALASTGVHQTRTEGPEVSQLKLAVMPLTDCASIVAAHEKGFFEIHGIDSSVVKLGSWTALRDAVVAGAVQGAQMLFGMPIAAAFGRLGSEPKPLVVPHILSRNGQAITLNAKYKGVLAADPSRLRPLSQKGRDSGRPLVFAQTLPVGTHSYWLRYWLAAGSIHPDNDVALITCPPPMMVKNMQQANMDGFCVGEPWNARAIESGVGYTAITSREIWQDHPEKVLVFTEEFAEKHPRTVKATIKALRQSGEWCDVPGNREELAGILSRPEYLDVPAELILGRLGDGFSYGDEREPTGDHQLIFSERNCNYPQSKYAVWFLTQMYRWGIALDSPDYGAAARRLMRPDLFEEAMTEMGADTGCSDLTPETLFDGKIFDPSQPDAYARSFTIHNIRS